MNEGIGTVNIKGRMAAFDRLCCEQGIRATHQRMEVFREVAQADEHPDAETVYRHVRRRVPAISLDTVYRTLRLFEEKKLIDKITCAGGRARFDANPHPHHHFICTTCCTVYDLYSEELNGVRMPHAASDMGTVNEIRVQLRGVCNACREREGRSTEPSGNVKLRGIAPRLGKPGMENPPDTTHGPNSQT